MKIIPPNHRGARSSDGFTLVEMIGVLSVISILASLLAPRVFQAINDSRIAAAAASYNGVKSAVNEYFGRYGLLGGLNGAVLNIANNAASEDWDLNVLVAGHDDDRRIVAGIAGLQLIEHVEAAQMRHMDVEQDQIEIAFAMQSRDAARIADRGQVGIARLAQQALEQVQLELLVVDNQDSRGRERPKTRCGRLDRQGAPYPRARVTGRAPR